MQVSELKGLKSLKAFYVFHKLMLGLNMLPEYRSVSYEDFYERIAEMSDSDKEKMIRLAAVFVDLQSDEIEALICFCKDKHGVPYSSENIKNLTPDVFLEIIVAVCVEISKIKINLVSEAEKKSLKSSLSTSVESLQDIRQ